ncbi:MAG: ABC transporter ATP-binding protein, partial [Deinococcus sp.]|nr:ABC transporter ATP-binding protein [Deinococcus sp.]
GPSGCGKTTTLRLIAGLEEADGGRIEIGDQDVTHLAAHARNVTMVFQSYALFPHLSVFENVAYGLRVAGRPRQEIEQRVQEALALVNLSGYEQRAPSQLSGGQQQRVALARALILKPQVLLFDEPLSNLDARLRKGLRTEIRALQQRLGITSVYVTHDQSEALAISDTIVVMYRGRIEQVGTPQELYARPRSRFVADFIGEANLLSGEVVAVQNGKAEVRLGDLVLQVLAGDRRPGPVTVLVRPEAIQVRPGTGRGLKGRVLAAAYQGATDDYLIETALGQVSVTEYQLAGGLLPPGSPVTLEIGERGICLLSAEEPA